MKPLRISTVSYLNSKPFVSGLQKYPFSFPVELMYDVPAVISEKLLTGKIDVGLAPVVTLLQSTDLKIISDFGIGADGEVGSVVLLSDKPLHDIRNILLSNESQTSNHLLKLLVNKCWKIPAEIIEPSGNSIADAKLMIGDKAMKEKKKYRYVFDLSGEWKIFTGLPFVFAAWIANRELSAVEKNEFEKAIQLGMNSVEKVIENEKPHEETDVRNYLTQKITFRLDDKMKEGLDLFLKMAREQEDWLVHV
jgi:chorismate dehydratase